MRRPTPTDIEERALDLALRLREEEGHYVAEYEDGIDLGRSACPLPIRARRLA